MRKNVHMRSYRDRWTPQQWQWLAAAVYERRIELGFSSRRALADAASIGKRTVDAVEMAEAVGKATLLRLEPVLLWERHSAEDVLAGKAPRQLAPPAATRPVALVGDSANDNTFTRPAERRIYDMLRRKGYSHEDAVDAILDLRREYEREKLLS